MNDIFGRQNLSSEIQSHLNEIISNSTFDKEELADRMCLYLSDFVLNDFQYEFRMGYNVYGIDVSLRSFHGFWYYISSLRLKKNYLHNKMVKQRIAEYFRLLSTSELLDISSFDLSFQDFSEANFSNVTFFGCLFQETNLSECELDGTRFSGCKIKNVDFTDSFLNETNFISSKVQKCSLSASYISDVQLTNSIFEEVNFTSARIVSINILEHRVEKDDKETRMKLLTCNFDNAEIDEKASIVIRKWYPEIDKQSVKILKEDDTDEEPTNEPKSINKNDFPENYKRIITYELSGDTIVFN